MQFPDARSLSRARCSRFARALLLATSQAGVAVGADVTEPIRIEYRATPGAHCPSEREFDAQVFARTASARAADSAEPARTFIVELGQAAGRITGSLVIQELDGTSTARRVTGSECADVARVLALATALAIDPRAELAPDQTLEESREPEPEPVEPSTKPESEAVATEPPRPEQPADVATLRVWSARWAVGVSAAFAVAPNPALGVLVGLSVHQRQLPPIGEFGFDLAYRQTSSVLVRDAEATFRYYVARPTICTLGLELGASFSAAPCVSAEVGAVTGIGSQIPHAEQRTRFWATGEFLLRLELDLTKAWYVTLDGGAAFPLTRYKFVFESPDTSIHEVPAVAASAALRIGSSF